MADETNEKPAGNVIEALTRVMSELPAIGKDGKAAPEQGGYAYRGIEQITREVQPLFAKHGVVMVPVVQSWERAPVQVGQKTWHDERLLVEYRVYGPGGIDDFIHVGPIAAIGRDGSDKGANKALTQSLKYALLQVLCISDSKDDADGTTHEADPEAPRAAAATLKTLRDGLKALGYYPEDYKEHGWPVLKEITAMIDGQVIPMFAAAAHDALAVVAAAKTADSESTPEDAEGSASAAPPRTPPDAGPDLCAKCSEEFADQPGRRRVDTDDGPYHEECAP